MADLKVRASKRVWKTRTSEPLKFNQFSDDWKVGSRPRY